MNSSPLAYDDDVYNSTRYLSSDDDSTNDMYSESRSESSSSQRSTDIEDGWRKIRKTGCCDLKSTAVVESKSDAEDEEDSNAVVMHPLRVQRPASACNKMMRLTYLKFPSAF